MLLLASVTPGAYAAEIQAGLDANPGSSYLRTDQACSSLSQATADGNPIYAVYRVAGADQGAVCAAVGAAGWRRLRQVAGQHHLAELRHRLRLVRLGEPTRAATNLSAAAESAYARNSEGSISSTSSTQNCPASSRTRSTRA